MPRLRLDALLVQRGLAPSRERARALIIAGHVSCCPAGRRPRPSPVLAGGGTTSRCSCEWQAGPSVRVAGRSSSCRGSRPSASSATGRPRSTSARRPADSPTAAAARCAQGLRVDVGYGQLDWKIRPDPRVRRARAREHPASCRSCPSPCDLAVIDVSFISLARSRSCRRACARRPRRRAGQAAVRGRARGVGKRRARHDAAARARVSPRCARRRRARLRRGRHGVADHRRQGKRRVPAPLPGRE